RAAGPVRRVVAGDERGRLPHQVRGRPAVRQLQPHPRRPAAQHQRGGPAHGPRRHRARADRARLMLICEDILLLLTRDDGRTEAWVSYRPYALAGGLLSDLALADCLEFEPTGKNPKVTLKGGPVGAPGGFADPNGGAGGEPPPADGPGAIMEFGLRALAGRSRPPGVQSVVTAGWFNPQEVVSRSLVAQGVVGLEEKRMLGLRPERY